MKSVKSLLSNKIALLVILTFLLVSVAVAFGYKTSKNEIKPQGVTEITGEQASYEGNDDLSKVVLDVSNMSCSGCIATIKASLSDIEGIKDILVDVSSGKTEVYYDSKKLEDISRIEGAITASGYPAKVQRIVTPEELGKEKALAAAKSQYYIASVGGWDIARSDFETELNIAKKRYSKIYGESFFASAQGAALLDNLKTQIVSRLINEGIFTHEVYKSGFKVDAETIERELEGFLKEHGKVLSDFEKSLNKAGYDFAYFKKKFETKVLVNRYLNEKILADASNEFERKSLYNSWFNNSKVLAEVVYYDKNLERLVQKQSTSSSCCPVK